jgi:predicted RNA-binding Zn-ribbon protein involved in translation (DUF1610 family)
MSDETAQAKFGCPECGRQFAWRPQIAGKSAKCKCGVTVHVPTESPAEDAPEQDPFEAQSESAGKGDEYGMAEESGYRCPSCRKSLAPGSVLCVHCGFNTRTGQRMNTAILDGNAPEPASAKGTTVAAMPKAGESAPRFPPGGHRMPAFQKEKFKASSLIKPGVIFVVLAVVVGGAVFGFRQLSGGDDDAAMHPIDRDVKKMMRENGSSELKAWLADNSRQQRMVLGMNERQGAGYADKLYKMGAKQVLAFGPLMTLILAVELPAEPAQRKDLFQFQTDWHTSMGREPQKDEGQNYIILHMKLVS